jgi:hypothetical protein
MKLSAQYGQRLRDLCRGDHKVIAGWLEERGSAWILVCCAVIFCGSALYGASVGLWRAPEQALYTALKMPLLIFLTAGANALLNGLLAQVLGSGLSFRHSAIIVLLSFTLASIILGALSPIVVFLLLNSPALSSAGRSVGHSITLLSDVSFVAYAGIVANKRLLRLLQHVCTTPAAGRNVFWSWLAVNLLLGAQLSWILRPFIGSPGLPVQFLRDDPFRGNFFESTFRALLRLF